MVTHARPEEGEGHYEMAMSCFASDQVGPPCDGQSFTMLCNEGSKESLLDCTGDEHWLDYKFAWEK